MLIQKLFPALLHPNRVLNTDSGEILPSGVLEGKNGKRAQFEFLNLNDETAQNTYREDFSLGKNFKGEGIYLLSTEVESTKRFWILVNQATLTVEKANSILEKLQEILNKDADLRKDDFWTLDGKKKHLVQINNALAQKYFYIPPYLLNSDPQLN